MSDFWLFARLMLRYRAGLITGLVLSVMAAAFLGVGLAAMVPIMKLMNGRESPAVLAERFNSEHDVLQIPAVIIDRLPDEPFNGIVLIICGLFVLTVLGATASFLHLYLSLTIATRTVTRIRQQIFRHVLHLPLGRVVERGPSEFVARVVRDASELQRGFMALTSKSVVQATRGVACFVAALFVCWEVAVVAPVGGVLFVVILRKFGKRIRRGWRGSLHAQENLLRVATESVQGLRAVKVNRAERHATWRFHVINKQVLKEEMRARIARAFSSPIVEMLATFMVGGLAIWFAYRSLEGGPGIDQFIVALAALAAAGASFRPMTGIVQEIQAASAPASRLREIVDEQRESDTRRRPDLPRHHDSLELDDVTFTYPATTQPALNHASLRIAHGERVAIVGPNGSGKTTLVSLLPRLLRPSDGRVLIDGVDVESVSLRSLREQIGVVTQETVLFRGSVAENIALGALGIGEQQILEAAQRAHAHEFILELDGGYDADIAEQGASLSGGQRQRLAIARAILQDPAILILDEATSQIDADSEAQIAAALQDFCQGRTAIIIAHRLATVMDADRIIVMDQGRVIDQGPHAELQNRCELYTRLARTQLVGPGTDPMDPSHADTVGLASVAQRHADQGDDGDREGHDRAEPADA